jgi:sulfur-oxidizing protein SoxA
MRLTSCFVAALSLVLAALSSQAQNAPPDARRSGFDMMQPALQDMQRDDSSNPGLLWAREGAALWDQKAGPDRRACADCHGDAAAAMRGVAARYPALDESSGKPIDLAGRIMQCRVGRQGAAPLARESRALLSLTTYVGLQSRGMTIAPPEDSRLAPFRAAGEALFQTRLGQLNLSCAGCHDANAGQKLGGSLIPEAHPTGYPIYRLEWQGAGSLQRRLRNCMIGVRADPYVYGSDEFIALELFLMRRAAGMAIETPAVRP